MCPHMPFFYEKNIFSTRLAFCMLRTAKKAAKGTRACLRSSSSALATVIQLSTPHRGRFWRCLVSLCSGAVRCTQPTDPPQVVFYAKAAQLELQPSKAAKRPPKPTRACFHCCSSALATVPQFRSIRPQLWQLKYCFQSTAVAMEASPGGFGRLFGCS